MAVIYFIQEAGKAEAPIKIGYTSGKVEDRLASLQTGYPAKLAIIASCEGTQSHESSVHGRFGHLRLHGEWFRPDDDLLGYIGRVTAASVTPPPVKEPTVVVPTRARSASQEIKAPKSTQPSTPRDRSFDDLNEGDRFGLLTFIGAVTLNGYGMPGASLVLVCDCGKEITITGAVPREIMKPGYGYGPIGDLLRGQVTSCHSYNCPIRAAERKKHAIESERLRVEAKANYDLQMRQLLEKARVVASGKPRQGDEETQLHVVGNN